MTSGNDERKLLINEDKMSSDRRILPSEQNIYDKDKPNNKKRNIIIGSIVVILIIVGIILAIVFSKKSDNDNNNPDPIPPSPPVPPIPPVPSGFNPYFIDDSESIKTVSSY